MMHHLTYFKGISLILLVGFCLTWLPAQPVSASALDADENGLYDPAERKLLLDTMLTICPELQGIIDRASAPVAQEAEEKERIFHATDIGQEEAQTLPRQDSKTMDAAQESPGALPHQNFDANGDGMVTIEEQAANRPPLSKLVPRRIAESATKIPWAIDIFPEWITAAYLQDDVAVGALAVLTPRGTVPRAAQQDSPALRPGKGRTGGGVEFAANSGQHLLAPCEPNARFDYRWCLFTFRIDGQSGKGNETVLLDVNRGKNAPGYSSPKIWFHRKSGLHIQYVGLNTGGRDRRIMTADNVIADGKTWNVVVCGFRYGQIYASVNGVALSADTPQFPRFCAERIKGDREKVKTCIGDENRNNMAWALDALVFGLTEPSEAMVRKMTGWAAHRLGFANNLPADHPYAKRRPVLDAEDLPSRYLHDNAKWLAWGAANSDRNATEEVRKRLRSHMGQPPVKPEGFERVFYDDFRADRIESSASGEADLWGASGWTNGRAAKYIQPEEEPDVYPHDAENQWQHVLVAKKKADLWNGGQIYSINDLGHGYTWAGPKIIRIRCKFTKFNAENMPPGLFPAFWSYGVNNIRWRTDNRLELDWFEMTGRNGHWFNGMAVHYHEPYISGVENIFAKNRSKYHGYKVHHGNLNSSISTIPGDQWIWDGKFRTWEFIVDQDMTYINLTIEDGNGGERWVELVRCQTPDLFLQEVFLILNFTIHRKERYQKMENLDHVDYAVDWIEVLQKTEDIEQLPAPFTARPELTGKMQAGETVTCIPHAEGISDIRYFWYADGYPLTYGPENTYVLSKAEAGKTIRCKVKAVGALDKPDAWSRPVEVAR